MEGTIIKGINNIYTVLIDDGSQRLCRIKGKVLRDIEDDKSPLVPADRVTIQPESDGQGMIVARMERDNQFRRYNLKRRMVQTVFANVDQLLCLVSVGEPTFRPGFVDRVLLCAGRIPVIIGINKCDLPIDSETEDQLQVYEGLGIPVLRMSVSEDMGITDLIKLCQGKRTALFGQSGVGKSTLVNRLIPEAEQRTNEISLRYNKGRHTTNYSVLFRDTRASWELLDTPGVREIEIPDLEPHQISYEYPEMEQYIGLCKFLPCLHIHEPGCAVRQGLASGMIDPGRYDRYVRIVEDQQHRSGMR